MFRLSRAFLFVVHSPRGVNFTLTSEESIQKIGDKYSRKWFGAKLDFLDVQPPQKEFLPFYFCSGAVDATFDAKVGYEEHSTDASGKPRSITRYQTFGPARMKTIFEPNTTQLYAGYKYNIFHVESALCNESLPMELKKMNRVDTSGATINLFEQSTATMHNFLDTKVKAQARESARAMVRAAHPMADSIVINFTDFSIRLDEVMPVFLPCYVVPASYDEQTYTLYVSGTSGAVSGPYLPNALYVGRVAGLTALTAFVLFTPNKEVGFVFGCVAGLVGYYVGFFAAKVYPSWKRDGNRRKRESMKKEYQTADTSGYRPNSSSERVKQEYHRSTYWDEHAYQKKKTQTDASGAGSDRSSSSSTGSEAGASSSRASSSGRSQGGAVSDSKGYYKTLGLHGDESVNEIRSAYRKLVLRQHPDVGGSTAEMTKLNEAYRVLRDPQRRTEYDRM